MTDRKTVMPVLPVRRRTALAALMLAAAVAAWQEPVLANFQAGVEAFRNGDYFTAWRELQRAAERDNNVTAKFYIGWMHEHGKGVPKDQAEAASWYLEAAQQGDVKAMNNLGSMYRDGRGVAKDPREAVRWFRHAAEAGHARAQVNLGLQFEMGGGLPKDPRQAVHWYFKAAEQSNVAGQFNLALMYFRGLGVDRDLPEAAKWFRRAAERGHVTAQLLLARLYEQGVGVDQDVGEALRLYTTAAEGGHPEAQYHLAELMEHGTGVDQDLTAAADYYRRAAEAGYAPAQAAYGRVLEDGIGVGQDREAALDWFRKAVEVGEPYAQFAIGRRYLDGDGVDPDAVLALDLFRKAAEHGQPGAALAAAEILERRDDGLRGDGDHIGEIAALYRMAAELGDGQAQLKLGRIYAEGLGVDRDAGRAAHWMDLAAAAADDADKHQIALFWLERDENLTAALALMEKLATDHPVRPDYAATLGQLKLATGDTDGGLEMLDRSFRLDSDNPDYAVRLGDAYRQAEQMRAARRYWMTALVRTRPGDTRRTLLIDKLNETVSVSANDEFDELTTADVKESQELLTDLGFNPGPADGILGGQTREAIRETQRWLGVEATGKLSTPLLEALRVMDPVVPPQPEPLLVQPPPGDPDPYGTAAPVRPSDVDPNRATLEDPFFRPQPQPERTATGQQPALPPVDPEIQKKRMEQEMLFWQSIQGSDDPADFEAYMRSFPNGLYVPLARNRLRAALEHQATQ